MNDLDWVRAWIAFQESEETENLGLRIEARRKLNELARAALTAAETPTPSDAGPSMDKLR